MKSILVTGGAGYIGSHTVKALLDADYDVHVLDNLASGVRDAVDVRAHFKELDVYDELALKDYLQSHKIDAVLHCAGEIVVSESIENPSKYFAANVAGMNRVLKVLSEVGIDKIIFSSTASVYGNNCMDKTAHEDTLLMLLVLLCIIQMVLGLKIRHILSLILIKRLLDKMML